MNLSLLLHTLRYLRPVQVVYQLRYRLSRPGYRPSVAPAVGECQLAEWTEKHACLSADGQFEFLNIADEFQGWDYTGHGMLWAYNQNYMDWLCQEETPVGERAKWIDRFCEDIGQHRVGLDPYPIALRCINWVKFLSRHGRAIAPERLRGWHDALFSQYKLLERKLEYHLLGNHLLEDAYSLYIGAVYFADAGMYRRAACLLRRELDEQTLPDGAHYELSPMYHCILLDRLLDCYNISIHNAHFPAQEEMNTYLACVARQMLGHLDSICYQDGTLPLVNDAALGIAPTPTQLRDYSRRLGLTWGALPLRECGYRRMTQGSMEATLDVGNVMATYQPGHTHADTLSFELRVDGQPFVTDTGISTYDKTPRRQYERSTEAHNTMTIDGRDSSEVWGGFRVGRRARVRILQDSPQRVEAMHDGYAPVRHTRRFFMADGALEVTDHLSLPAQAVARLHLTPGVRVKDSSLQTVDTSLARIVIEGAQQVEVKDCQVSERYNQLQDTKVVEIHFQKDVKVRLLPFSQDS